MTRIQSIDLLRGVAVALVMLRHAFPDQFAGAGVVGVVMFFSLSGYLITGVLLRDAVREGRVRFGRFYLRRTVRLVPALVLMVAALVVITLAFDPVGDRAELPRTVLIALTYTADLPIPQGSPVTFHLWTLAVEEQFYLVWPALLAFAWRRGRVGMALAAVGVLWAAACIASLVWAGPHPDLVYTFPTSWVGCFAIGAAARVAGDRVRVPRWAAAPALVVLLALSVVPLRGHASTYLAAGPIIAAVTAALLLAWREWQLVRQPPLRLLVALGTVSYGAYLWNYPITLWLRPIAPWAGLIAIALTIAAASVSWWLVEKPAARLLRQRQAVAG